MGEKDVWKKSSTALVNGKCNLSSKSMIKTGTRQTAPKTERKLQFSQRCINASRVSPKKAADNIIPFRGHKQPTPPNLVGYRSRCTK